MSRDSQHHARRTKQCEAHHPGALDGSAPSRRSALESVTTGSVIANNRIPDSASRRRRAASGSPLPASSTATSDVWRSNLVLCVSRQSIMAFCHAAASRSFVERAVKYDTIEVSMYTVFLSIKSLPSHLLAHSWQGSGTRQQLRRSGCTVGRKRGNGRQTGWYTERVSVRSHWSLSVSDTSASNSLIFSTASAEGGPLPPSSTRTLNFRSLPIAALVISGI